MLWILSQMVVHGRLADFFHYTFIFKAIQSVRRNPEHLILLLLLLLFAYIAQPYRRIDSRFLANQHSVPDAKFWKWSRRRLLRCWYSTAQRSPLPWPVQPRALDRLFHRVVVDAVPLFLQRRPRGPFLVCDAQPPSLSRLPLLPARAGHLESV
jgi:hypothetical protein